MIFLILLPYFVTVSQAVPEDSLLINRLINGHLGYSGHQPEIIGIAAPLPIHETKNSKSYGLSEITEPSGVKRVTYVGEFGSLDKPKIINGVNIIHEGVAEISNEPSKIKTDGNVFDVRHHPHGYSNEPYHSLHHFDSLQHLKHHSNFINPEDVREKDNSEEAVLNIKPKHVVSEKQYGIVKESSSYVDEASNIGTHDILNSHSDRGVANINIHPEFGQFVTHADIQEILPEPLPYYHQSPEEVLGTFALEQFLSEPDTENQYPTWQIFQEQNEPHYGEKYPGIIDQNQNFANIVEFLDFSGEKLNNQFLSEIGQSSANNVQSSSIQTAQLQGESSVAEESSIEEEQHDIFQSSFLEEQFPLLMLELMNQYRHYQQFGWTVPYVYPLPIPITSETPDAEIASIGLHLSAKYPSIHVETNSKNLGSVKELEVEHRYGHHQGYLHHEKPLRSKDIIIFSRFGEDEDKSENNFHEHTPKPDEPKKGKDDVHSEERQGHKSDPKIESTHIEKSISKTNEPELVALESSKSTLKVSLPAVPEGGKHQEHTDERQTDAKEIEEHHEHNVNDTKDSISHFEKSTLPTLFLSEPTNNLTHPEVPDISMHLHEEEHKLNVNITKESEPPVVDSTPLTQANSSENEIGSGVETLVKRTTIFEDPRVVTLTIKLPPKSITKEVEVTKTADGHENIDLSKEREVAREVGGPIRLSVNDSEHSELGEKEINVGSLQKILNLIPH